MLVSKVFHNIDTICNINSFLGSSQLLFFLFAYKNEVGQKVQIFAGNHVLRYSSQLDNIEHWM